MTFAIDTGQPQRAWNPLQIDRCGEIRAIAVDSLPEDATQAQIDGAIALAVMGDLHTPKRLDTVRRHLMALMPLIAELARTSPASVDEIFIEYAELTTVLR